MIRHGRYFPAERCVGRAEDSTLALMAFCIKRYHGMKNGGTYACRNIAGSARLSVHAAGRALDPLTGTGATTTDSRWLAEQMRVFSRELGIQGIIHNGKQFFCNRDLDWTPYNGANNHFGHIHTELVLEGFAPKLTPSYISKVLIGPSINGSTLFAGGIVREGDHNEHVLYVQRRLRQHGYGIAWDGICGPETVKAIRSFQTLAGIPVDGVAGVVTQGRMR